LFAVGGENPQNRVAQVIFPSFFLFAFRFGSGSVDLIGSHGAVLVRLGVEFHQPLRGDALHAAVGFEFAADAVRVGRFWGQARR